MISLQFLGVKLSKERKKAFQISLNSEAALQMLQKYAEILSENIRAEVRFQ